MKTTGTMNNAQWVAIHSTRPIDEVITLLKDRQLSQRGLTSFWKALSQVKSYFN